jgi:hypothetical protein
MDDSLNAQSLTCGARPGLQARTVAQAWGNAPRNPCFTPGPLPEGEGENRRNSLSRIT